MELIKYALPITLVLLYALQDTILPPMKNHCDTYPCMIIGASVTLRDIKRGLCRCACLPLMIALCLVLLTTLSEYGISV
nr:protein ANTHESIS POMOTING FACTOR 1 isoform X2 [Ipomoea batatas]